MKLSGQAGSSPDRVWSFWWLNKRFGIGWTPATWEGWLCIGVFILWVIGIMLRFEKLGFSESATLEQFVFPVFFGVFVLIVVSVKTGEPLQWNWRKREIVTMRLHNEPFLKIMSGQKKVEVRLYDEKRRGIHTGDTLEFTSRSNPTQKLMKQVAAIHTFPTFEALFIVYPAERTDVYQYYTKEDEQQYGAVAIEFED